MNSKRFGVLSSLFLGLFLVFVSFVFNLNLLAIPSIGKIPIYFWLILILFFFVFTYVGKNIQRKTFNWIYLNLAFVSFVYLNSMFQWSVACCPEEYDSMYDWNASVALAWIVQVPLVFVILITLGLLVDFLRELNLKKNKGF